MADRRVLALLPGDVSWPEQAAVWTLRNLYVWSMLLAILGWAHALLNRPFRWLPWANENVYPWYMLHQSLIVLFAYWLLPLHLHPLVEAVCILALTVASANQIIAVLGSTGSQGSGLVSSSA